MEQRIERQETNHALTDETVLEIFDTNIENSKDLPDFIQSLGPYELLEKAAQHLSHSADMIDELSEDMPVPYQNDPETEPLRAVARALWHISIIMREEPETLQSVVDHLENITNPVRQKLIDIEPNVLPVDRGPDGKLRRAF